MDIVNDLRKIKIYIKKESFGKPNGNKHFI